MKMILLSLFIALTMVSAQMMRMYYPQTIAHRGASGYVPEHSLAAYKLAIDLETDYIEPDLCLSKDGVFVAMHDLLLDDTTNVASLPQYADRYTTKQVAGQNMSGYFVSDFLYEELLDLRLKQRLPERTKLYDNLFQIPTFDQIMDLAMSEYNSSGILRGIYPELKHPEFFDALGFPMVDMLLTSLAKGGYPVRGSEVSRNLSYVVPVVIQCFDYATLQRLNQKTDIPLIYLIQSNVSLAETLATLDEVSSTVDGLGISKSLLGNLPFLEAKKMIDDIHTIGLMVHPWTFRADQDILPRFGTNFAMEEMYFYACLGIDAAFSEFPDRTRQTIDILTNITSIDPHHLQAETLFTTIFNKKCGEL
jgi:glycerophosphoryl diester phosphodiesterase